MAQVDDKHRPARSQSDSFSSLGSMRAIRTRTQKGAALEHAPHDKADEREAQKLQSEEMRGFRKRLGMMLQNVAEEAAAKGDA
jgi:hypothetical protein